MKSMTHLSSCHCVIHQILCWEDNRTTWHFTIWLRHLSGWLMDSFAKRRRWWDFFRFFFSVTESEFNAAREVFYFSLFHLNVWGWKSQLIKFAKYFSQRTNSIFTTKKVSLWKLMFLGDSLGFVTYRLLMFNVWKRLFVLPIFPHTKEIISFHM